MFGGRKERAFTLIELLVVIGIIGLLSSIVLASLSGARESARITKTAEDFRQIETALNLWMTQNGFTQWPNANESEVCGGTSFDSEYGESCPILEMVNNSNSSFPEALPVAPEVSLSEATGKYMYFYERWQSPDCNDDPDRLAGCGVNISLSFIGGNNEVVSNLDDVIDGGDGRESGKFRWGTMNGPDGDEYGRYLYYHISDDHSY